MKKTVKPVERCEVHAGMDPICYSRKDGIHHSLSTAHDRPDFIEAEYANGTRSHELRLPNPVNDEPALIPVAVWFRIDK